MSLLRLIKNASFSRMKECMDEVYKRSGKSYPAIWIDMVVCALLFGAGYYDYKNHYFEKLSFRQRNQYFTRGRYKKFLRRCHDKSFDKCFGSKSTFAELFREYMHREIINLEQVSFSQFVDFVKRHSAFFAKVDDGEGGVGVSLIIVEDDTDLYEVYQKLMESGQIVLEEKVNQCHQTAAFNPTSVNTYRIVTLVQDGWTEILSCVLRVGAKGSNVDNLCSGGMAYAVEKETGVIISYGKDIDFNYIPGKTVDGEEMLGMQLFGWQEAIAMCKEAGKKVPAINMVGWDVAVTEEGPLLIEGNGYPGMDLCQMKLPDGTERGLWKRLRHYYLYSGKIMTWLMKTRMIPKEELNQYVEKKYPKFQKKYGETIKKQTHSQFLQKLAMAILIAEDHQRPKCIRILESVTFLILKISRIRKQMTLGIAQVSTDRLLSDKKSVVKEVGLLKKSLKDREFSTREEAIRYAAHSYNHCNNYVEKVLAIYRELLKYSVE